MRYILISMLCLFARLANGQEQSQLMREGTEYFSNKQYTLALQSFQDEYRRSPSVEVKFRIAHTYALMNEINKAKPLFYEIIHSGHSGPEVAMSLINLANCYRSLKQTDSAYFYYDKAIAEFPNRAGGYFNKGQLLYAESRFEDARSHFDKAVEIEPDNWWYYQKRLEVCFASRDFECALHDLIMVNKLNPEVENEMNLAYCYTMLNRYQEADSIFQSIYDETDAFFLNNYGMNRHNMGNTAEGKEIILKSLSINPKNSYAYRNLAVIGIEEDDKSKACEYLQKARSLGFEKHYGNEVNELISLHCR